MELYIIRHAWAGHFGDPDWPDDSLRPLTAEGKKRFAQMVNVLIDRGFQPQIIATSPLVRCRQTAQLVAEGVSGDPEIVELNALEPGGDFQALWMWTTGQAKHCKRIAWVGHAPDVGRMAAAMIGETSGWIHFAKGTIASIRFDEGLPTIGNGELRWLVTAKLLGF